ncbi:uncharacterized protein [Narcine bancroftii]|uniref:uncharacterized protein n=1 Tax=Narcine bancroftii TaxID=1343680 RepID=UPI0038320182
MMIWLPRYTLNVALTPGKLMFSRAVDMREPANSKMDEDVNAFMDMITRELPISDAKMELVKSETNKNETLRQMRKKILDRWPNLKQDCSSDISEYWNCRVELSVVEDVIYKGSKILIPKSLRKEVLKEIHGGHLRMEKCKERAREVMYWPIFNNDMTNEVSNCAICQKYQAINPSEPLKAHPAPYRTSQKWCSKSTTKGGKKHRKSRKESYYKLLKQVHPDTGISFKAMSIMNSLVNNIFNWIVDKASRLAHYNKRSTISSWEIQTAMRLLLPGQLAKHTMSEGSKAVTKYTSSK